MLARKARHGCTEDLGCVCTVWKVSWKEAGVRGPSCRAARSPGRGVCVWQVWAAQARARVAVEPEVDASLPRPPPPPLLLARRPATPAPPGARSYPAARSVTASAAATRACNVINRDKNYVFFGQCEVDTSL